ncbi:pseudouridine synthase [Paxillus ammoniavirescens]|nr:pseudouridine synthase [Paxillus ammoniavirescens]
MSDSPGQRQPSEVVVPPTPKSGPGLKKMPPYWYPYTTMAKERWLGREILEIVSTEFRDRSMEYYRYALESGVTTINGKVAKPDTIVKNGDRIENVVHRHEPPVTATPVKIILHDKERDFLVIDKPGSIPVHASGRYYRHSLVEILRFEFGFEKVYTINRLDRLTSGLMIIPLNADVARLLTKEFMNGSVRKEYVARCKGKFPTEEVVCEQPLLTVDRQMGLNIVHPEGKPAKTVFNKLHYDANTNTSVLRCRPFTGRSHQIRVHLQYLGHPIANDPVYSEERIWGINLGKNGIDVIPSAERSAPAPPEHLKSDNSPESLGNVISSANSSEAALDAEASPEAANAEGEADVGENGEPKPKSNAKKLLPRETGQDIGMGSPVPLSAEAVQVITRLRNMKDEDEDWSRWRDVVFRAKGALTPKSFRKLPPLPPQNRRKKVGPEATECKIDATVEQVQQPPSHAESLPIPQTESQDTSQPPQITLPEAVSLLPSLSAPPPSVDTATGTLYCPECYLPLHPDPKPEKLYIFLHALKYELSLGSFETEMPEWAKEGWEWDV